MSIADLGGQAREFAGHITNLLNRTVTNGIRIKAVLNPTGSTGWVGYKISKALPQAVVAIPITTGRADLRGYLVVLHRLALDAEGTYITTTSSRLELHLTADLEQPIVRYDYNRDPVLAKNGLSYPPAHVHVHGEHGPVDQLAEAAAASGSSPTSTGPSAASGSGRRSRTSSSSSSWRTSPTSTTAGRGQSMSTASGGTRSS